MDRSEVFFVKHKKAIFYTFVGLGFAIVIVGFIIFQWNVHFNLKGKIDPATVGQYGDLIGGTVGTLWALLGVIFFYIALTEQREDFKTNKEAFNLQIEAFQEQSKQFELQNKELESSRKVYEEQNKTQKLQQFDSNFYSLLNVFLNIKNNIEIKEENFFKNFFDEIITNYESERSIEENFELIIKKYTHLYNDNNYLSQYFKTFYRILKIIDTSPQLKKNSDRILYSKILRSQLSDFEVLILLYNSYSIYGTNSQSLILKYNILKHKQLVSQPEYKKHIEKIDVNNLIFFTGNLKSFISNNINKFYGIDGIENDSDRFEISENIFKGILSIEYNENIDIKVIIPQANFNLDQDDFLELLKITLINFFCIDTYLNFEKINFTTYYTAIENNKIFGCKIITTELLNINVN